MPPPPNPPCPPVPPPPPPPTAVTGAPLNSDKVLEPAPPLFATDAAAPLHHRHLLD